MTFSDRPNADQCAAFFMSVSDRPAIEAGKWQME
jgi:hypothetical protein